MSENVTFLLAAGLVAAVLLALVLGRVFRLRWGDKGIETDAPAGTSAGNRMVASSGGKIHRARQTMAGDAAGGQEMKASTGGELLDVEQNAGRPSERP